MWLKKIKNKNLLFPGSLLFIGVLVYHSWLNFSLFAFGDWWFSFRQSLIYTLFPNAAGAWGGPWLWKYPYFFLSGIFGLLGFDFNVAEKFIVFWQIAFLTPIAGFLLVKKITNSTVAGFIGSLIFSYNTYYLSIDSQGHNLLTVAFSWGAFAFLSFIYLLDSKRKIFVPITSILLFVVGFYDLRSLYVVLGIISLYFIYHQLVIEKSWKIDLKKNLINFLAVNFIFGLLSLYWLLPVLNLHALTNNEFLTRSLFGSEFYNLQNSLTFFYPFWTGKQPTWLYLQKIPISFWLYPLIAFSGMIVARKNKKIAFFGLLSIIGIFLTKQEGQPFPYVYDWLYLHLPGFNAFREASKFDFITLIGYSVLFGAFTKFVLEFKNRRLRLITVFFIALFPLINTVPLLTGEINALFIPHLVPGNYAKLGAYIAEDSAYSKVLGINTDNYYSFTTDLHPQLDFSYAIRNVWGTDLLTFNANDLTKTEGDKLVRYLNSSEGRRLLAQTSVGYLPVFVADKATNQNLRRDTGEDASFYEKSLDKTPYLKKVNINLTNIILYKDLDFKPHLYLTPQKDSLKKDVPFEAVDYAVINPAQYRINFKNIKNPVYLNFSELYQPDWKIYLGNFSWWKVLFGSIKPLPEDIHFQNAVRYNGFLIDPSQICRLAKCISNNDGSVSFQVTLYFRSQSYLYLGLILSTISLIGSILGVFYFWRKERSEK